jgi:two-component system, chemotaxis family, chemotaxis protein CheY
MPVLDGIEFTRAVRSRADGGEVPIIILTTESGSEIKAEGRKAGATAWMVKPFDPQRLLDMLGQLRK